MTVKETCIGISGVLAIIAFVPYILGILRRTIEPLKATWVVWWFVDMTALLSMWQQHALNAQMPAVVIGSTITTMLAFKYGKPGWTRLDKICLVGASIAIAVWLASGEAHFGLIGFIVCNWIGFIPTLQKAWTDPESQKNITWQINAIGSAFALIGMPEWTFAHAATPVTFLLMTLLILAILYLRPRPQRAAS